MGKQLKIKGCSSCKYLNHPSNSLPRVCENEETVRERKEEADGLFNFSNVDPAHPEYLGKTQLCPRWEVSDYYKERAVFANPKRIGGFTPDGEHSHERSPNETL